MKRYLLLAVTLTLVLPFTPPAFGQTACTPVPILIPFSVKGKIEITDCLQYGYYSDRYSVFLDVGTQVSIEATAPSSTTLSWITVDIQRWIDSGPNMGWNRVLERTEYTPERNALKFDFAAPYATKYLFLITGGSSIGDYNFSLKYITSTPEGPTLAGVLAIVGSTQGNGAYFRTGVQMHNPRTTPINGKLVFHPQGFSGGANDTALAYTLNAGQTIEYSDILPAMGISSGLGSLDIVTGGDPLPVMAARVFSDAGINGTAGFFIEPLAPEDSLEAGDSGVIIAPADPTRARLNIGYRSLDAGATFVVTVRNKNGVVRSSQMKTYGPNFFEQVSANTYLGLTLDGSDTITFTVTSGKVIVYGAQTDNKTQDPSMQYAKKIS